VELAKDARQLLRGDVEERGVGEDAGEARGRQIERQEVHIGLPVEVVSRKSTTR
jgi:hypothetical protein